MNKIRILGREYKVKKKKLKTGPNYTIFGETKYREHEIHLHSDNGRGQDMETLFHEIFHVVSNLTGSKLSEKQVTAMSTGIYSVLKDNKKLL